MTTPTRLKLRSMRGTFMWLIAFPELPSLELLGYSAAVSAIVQATLPVFWLPVGLLFVVLLLLMSGDLATKWLGMLPENRKIFIWEQEITGKFLLFSLVVLSLLLDLIIFAIGRSFPNMLLLDTGYLFVTLTTELWLIAAETSRIVTNISTRAGRENIPPPINFVVDQIRWVLTTIRTIDRQRLRRASPLAPDKPDFDRWYDHLTTDDMQELRRRVEARMGGTEIPEPPVFSADRGSP